MATTIHGPFNEELTDLYRANADRVPIIAISHAQHRAAPDIPIARVIHHGVDAIASSRWATAAGDADGPYVLFLGRMAADKGAHRAIEVARRAGIRILMAAKMREPWEMRYFTEQVEPLLGPDAVYLGEVSHERKLELLAGASALLFPIRWNEPFGMVMIEAMACGTPVLAFPEGAAPEVVDDGTHRVPVRGRGRHGRGHRPARRARARGLPAGRRGLLLHPAHGGRAHRAVRVDDRPERRRRPDRRRRRSTAADDQDDHGRHDDELADQHEPDDQPRRA